MRPGRERMNSPSNAKCVDAMEKCVRRVNNNLAQVCEVVNKLNVDDRIVTGVDSCTSVVRELVNVLGDLKSYAETFHHTGTSLANAIHFQLTEQAKQNTKFAMAAESMSERLAYLECSMTNMLGPPAMRHPQVLPPNYHIPPAHCWPSVRAQLASVTCNGTSQYVPVRSSQPAPPLFFRRQALPTAAVSSEDALDQTRFTDRPIKRRHRKPVTPSAMNGTKAQQVGGLLKAHSSAGSPGRKVNNASEQVGNRVGETTVQVCMIPLFSDGNRMRNFMSMLAYDQSSNHLSLISINGDCAGRNFRFDLGSTTTIKGADRTIGLHTGRETFLLRFDQIEAMERYAAILVKTAPTKRQ